MLPVRSSGDFGRRPSRGPSRPVGPSGGKRPGQLAPEQSRLRRALVIDDDASVRAALMRILRGMRFEVDHLASGERAIEAVQDRHYDLAMLDLNLPGMSGHDVLGELKHLDPSMVIIVVTGSQDVEDVVNSLELGADDHVTKPLRTDEVQARVRKAFRSVGADTRAVPDTEPSGPAGMVVSEDGVFEIDLKLQSAKVAGERTDLTPSEFQILRHLVANPGQVFTHKELGQVPGAMSASPAAVTEFVRRLRKKTDPDKEYIHTRRAVGYFFQVPDRPLT